MVAARRSNAVASYRPRLRRRLFADPENPFAVYFPADSCSSSPEAGNSSTPEVPLTQSSSDTSPDPSVMTMGNCQDDFSAEPSMVSFVVNLREVSAFNFDGKKLS